MMTERDFVLNNYFIACNSEWNKSDPIELLKSIYKTICENTSEESDGDKIISHDKFENNKCYYKHPEHGYIRINHEDGDYSEICRNKLTGKWTEYCKCTE